MNLTVGFNPVEQAGPCIHTLLQVKGSIAQQTPESAPIDPGLAQPGHSRVRVIAPQTGHFSDEPDVSSYNVSRRRPRHTMGCEMSVKIDVGLATPYSLLPSCPECPPRAPVYHCLWRQVNVVAVQLETPRQVNVLLSGKVLRKSPHGLKSLA